jgi:hypothetical protein
VDSRLVGVAMRGRGAMGRARGAGAGKDVTECTLLPPVWAAGTEDRRVGLPVAVAVVTAVAVAVVVVEELGPVPGPAGAPVLPVLEPPGPTSRGQEG